MSVKFDQFVPITTMAVSSQVVGLYNGNNTIWDFPGIGINDASNNPLLRWTAGSGTNVNYVQFTSASTGSAPLLSSGGSDTNINLNIGATGTGHVQFTGTGAFGLPSGTQIQQPAGFLGGLRYDISTDKVEYWSTDNTAWEALTAASGTINAVDGTAPIVVTTSGTTATVSLTTPLVVQYGGTGDTTFTAYSVICAGTTATGAFQNVSGLGTSGYVLTSNGAGALPTWQANAAGVETIDGDSGSATGSTITITGGSTGLTTSGSSATLTLTGTLNLASGGTNNSLTASNGGIVYSDASKLDILGGTGTALQALLSGVSSAPSWSTATYPATTTVNELLYSSGTNAITGLATVTAAVLTTVSGVPTWASDLSVALGGTGNTTLTAYAVLTGGTTSTGALQQVSGLGTSGYVLTSNGAAALPTWQPASGGGGTITTIDGDSGSVTGSTVTLSGGSTGLVTGTSGTTMSLSGTVNIGHGGTGNTTFNAYSVICAGITNTGAFQNVSGVGTAGQVLTSNGAAALPSWQGASGGGGITTIDGDSGSITGSTVTITGGSTGLTTSGSGTTLTLTGTLAVTHGGTGAATLTGLLTGNGTSAITGTAITQYSVITGGATNLPNSVAPSGTSGVPLISQGAASQPAFGTAVVAGGGTGLTATTAYAVVCGGTTTTGALQQVSGLGTTGYILTSNGAGALPTWQANIAANASAVTKTITASNTFSVFQAVYLNGTAYALAQANNLATAESVGIVSAASGSVFTVTTSGYISGLTGLVAGDVYWLSDTVAGLLQTTMPTTIGNVAKPMFIADTTTSGYLINYRGDIIPATFTLPVTVANGGTGVSSLTAYELLAGGTTSTGNVQQIPLGVSGQILQSAGAGALSAWSTSTYPASNAINTLLYASSANVMAALATANNSILVTSAGGVPSLSGTLPFTVPVTTGGTGLTTLTTAYGIVAAGTTATGALQNVGTGTTGQVLTSNGSAALATWQGSLSSPNYLINPSFQINQAGGTYYNNNGSGTAAFSHAASFNAITADRWELLTGANQASTTTQIGPTTGGSPFRIQRQSGQTGTGVIRFCQSLPPEYCYGLANNIVTVSFSGLCGANYSAASNHLVLNVYTGTGNTFVSGINGAFTGNATQSQTSTLTTSQATYTFTTTALGSSVTQVAVEFAFTPVGTASTNDWFELYWVKLEVGSTATAFQFNRYSDDLSECWPFKRKTIDQSVQTAQGANSTAGLVAYNAQIASTTDGYSIYWALHPPMYADPTITFLNPSSNGTTGKWYNYTGAAASGTGAITTGTTAGVSGVSVNNPQVAGDSAGNVIAIHLTANCEPL